MDKTKASYRHTGTNGLWVKQSRMSNEKKKANRTEETLTFVIASSVRTACTLPSQAATLLCPIDIHPLIHIPPFLLLSLIPMRQSILAHFLGVCRIEWRFHRRCGIELGMVERSGDLVENAEVIPVVRVSVRGEKRQQTVCTDAWGGRRTVVGE